MKKILSVLLGLLIAMSCVACGADVEAVAATDAQKESIIDVLKKVEASDFYQKAHRDFETITAQKANDLELLNAFIFKYDDFEGMSVHFILLNVEADVAFGDALFDKIQIAYDVLNDEIYDSMTLQDLMNNLPAKISTMEEAAALLLNSGSLTLDKSDFIYSEQEDSTRLTKEDIKEINAAKK